MTLTPTKTGTTLRLTPEDLGLLRQILRGSKGALMVDAAKTLRDTLLAACEDGRAR